MICLILHTHGKEDLCLFRRLGAPTQLETRVFWKKLNVIDCMKLPRLWSSLGFEAAAEV